MRKALIAVAALSILAGCTLSNEQQVAAGKAYDKICTAEPPLYNAYVVVATAKGTSAQTLAKVAKYHQAVATLCAERPADLVTALVTLSGIYAQIVSANAKL